MLTYVWKKWQARLQVVWREADLFYSLFSGPLLDPRCVVTPDQTRFVDFAPRRG